MAECSQTEAGKELQQEEHFDLGYLLKTQRKHFFILSEAGKPIFSVHGNENETASLSALMQAIASYVQDGQDNLRSFSVQNGGRIVFLQKGPLLLVAVTSSVESNTQLTVQLTYLYNQVLSLLTESQLNRLFAQSQSFDLRCMIGGSERILRSLCHGFNVNPSYLLSAVRVLPMPHAKRNSLSTVITRACEPVKNVVFAILMTRDFLVTLVRMKQYFVHPADLHLLFNLINSTESFKQSENWTPICLPKFNSSGFLHAYVSYIFQDICLLMVAAERNLFFELSKAKDKIMKEYIRLEFQLEITKSLNSAYVNDSECAGATKVRHFLYKTISAGQYTESSSAIVHNEPMFSCILRLYHLLQTRIHCLKRPNKLLFFQGSDECAIAWTTPSFELYATLSTTMTKVKAIDKVNKLVKYCKREEANLFILNAPTF